MNSLCAEMSFNFPKDLVSMKAFFATIGMAFLGISLAFADIGHYDELISATIKACDNPDILQSVAYTNDIANFRNACTNAEERCATDLALAISLMHRMDHDEDSVGAATCFERHQYLVSNILASAELAQGSWIRYAAALEYVCGFNYDNRSDKGFSLSTNMLANLAATPIDMGHTNYWDAMARLMKCSSLTLPMALKLNVAITLAEQNRWSEVGVYTNGMPHSAIEVFMDELR